MKRDDVMAVVNLRASMVAAQREYDELELSDNITPSGEVLPLTANEEFVIRRYAAISLMYHQAVHRYYGLPVRVPVAGPSVNLLDFELAHS
jgi:acyl CoA:acetate/3-ketoacid CoA transferase